MQLIKGTLDLIVLKALTWDRMHGFAIAAWIEQQFGGDLVLEEGALYQSLRRMEERGWIDGEWGVSEINRKARYYKITTAGRRQLRDETVSWESYSEALTRVLRTT
jgi:transcriptional regulator